MYRTRFRNIQSAMLAIAILYGKWIIALAIISMLLTQCKAYYPAQFRFTKMKLVSKEPGRWRANEDRALLVWEDFRKPPIRIETEIKIEDTGNYRVGMVILAALPK